MQREIVKIEDYSIKDKLGRIFFSYDDYTNAIYDNENKEWYGVEFITEDFIESGSTVVSFKFDKQSKDIEIMEADYADLL